MNVVDKGVEVRSEKAGGGGEEEHERGAQRDANYQFLPGLTGVTATCDSDRIWSTSKNGTYSIRRTRLRGNDCTGTGNATVILVWTFIVT